MYHCRTQNKPLIRAMQQTPSTRQRIYFLFFPARSPKQKKSNEMQSLCIVFFAFSSNRGSLNLSLSVEAPMKFRGGTRPRKDSKANRIFFLVFVHFVSLYKEQIQNSPVPCKNRPLLFPRTASCGFCRRCGEDAIIKTDNTNPYCRLN